MAPPNNGIYIVLGEMNLVVTAMRPVSKWNSHTYQDDGQDPLLRGFSNLKEILTSVTHLSEVEPNLFLSPFLDVIRSEDTSGPITGLALTSVNKFLSYGLVDPSCETGAAAVENIADAVTHARFVGTDTGSDEVVLMKILYVLRTLLLTPVGAQMTNESVCEIMQSCFRICFEVRLGELLRKSAEHTLMDMVQLLFSGLPQFREDNRWEASIKKLKMRASTMDTTRGIKKKKSPRSKHKKNNQANSEENLLFPTPPPSTVTTPESSSPSNLTILSINTGRTEFTHHSTTKFNSNSTDNLPINSLGSYEAAYEDKRENTEEKDKSYFNDVQSSIESSEPSNAVLETSDDQEVLQSSNTSDNIISPEPEYVNPRGVRFTTQQNKEGIGPLIPYGLPCVRELFRFLISLINPSDRHNTEIMIHMGLNLLTVALEAGADHIGCFNSLISLVKDDLCRNLFSLLQTERLTMFASALRVCFLLFESMRSYLKFQLEMYLIKLMDMTVSENPRIFYEQREIALDSVVQMWRIPGLVTELYLNYDCDLYCSNLFEDLTKLLSKNAFPVSGLYSIHLLSLDALLIVVDNIETHCHSRILNGSKASLPSSNNTEETVNVSESSNNQPENNVMIPSPPASGYIVAQKFLEKKDPVMDNDQKLIRDQKKLPHIKPNRMKVSTIIPTHEELIIIKHRKKVLHAGTEQFNIKASKGIMFLQEQSLLSSELNPGEIVTFLRENPKLDKKMIGEYISNRKNLGILEAFVKSFNFEDTRIDEALRMYLETFRLPGEAPVISLLMEHFAEHWHKTNGEPFANHDAAFTLAYAVIMLNVDQHNHNVKKQNNPMTVEEFKRNLTSVNGGQEFDQEMLEEIYNSIRNEEIVMPAEQVGQVKENYLWKVLLRRGLSKEGAFLHVPNGLFDHDLFSLIWGPTVAALSFVFDKSVDEIIIQKAISGFRKCAMISAHYGMSDVFDSLVISLCKFTTLLSSAESPETLPVLFGNNLKAQMAAKTMFNLAHRHGDILREGWKNILDCMVLLYRSKLLPKIFMEVEDYVDPSGKISLIREEAPSQRTESGLLTSFYLYITLNTETPNQRGSTIEDQEAFRQARNTIQDCHPEQLITESKFLHLDSLQELVKALILASQGPDAHLSLGTHYDEEAAIFYLEFLIKVILHNRDRVSSLWQMVRDHFFSLIVHSGECTFLVERSVVGLLRLAIGLLRREDMAAQVLASIRMLLLMKSSVLMKVSQQVAFALHELLKTNAANIHLAQDWYTLFTLLECVGAGANPPPLTHIPGGGGNYSVNFSDTGAQSDSEINSNEFVNTQSDRGYTSDSELYGSPSKHQCQYSSLELDVKPVNSGGWLLVGKDGETERSMSKSMPVINQYSIILHEDLKHHDRRSFMKACESLAFLIRDVAHITPENFDSCVHCIRTFVEASLNGGRHISEKKSSNNIQKNGKDKKSMHRMMSRKREDSRMKRSRSNPGQITHPISDDELENEEQQGDYHQLSLQLLDLMHTLHTRAASIFSSWAEEERQRKLNENIKNGNLHIDAGTGTMWIKCWCPLLQGIARLCCDSRRQVRTSALTYLQRALLVHDLQTLSASEWESCFNKVLFPLLTKLLDNINQHDPVGMEETRMRGATLLCKVFLQHLSPLQSLPTFTALWLTILDFMDKYMHAYKSDMLYEAIPESLKNMLLVMNTAGVFQIENINTQLWSITWDRLDGFLPGLRNEVFKPHEPELRKINKELIKTESEIIEPLPTTVLGELKSKEQDVIPPIESCTNGLSETIQDPVKCSLEEKRQNSSHLTSNSITPPTAAFILQPPLPTVISPKSGVSPTQHLPLLLNPELIEGTAIPIISPQGTPEHKLNLALEK